MNQVTVIGGGTMGNGIAHVFAMNGYKVQLADINADVLAKAIATIDKNLERMVAKEKISAEEKAATLSRITTHTDLKDCAPHSDLVIEAATENIDLKLKIFRELDEMCQPSTILATNTSSISITKIAAATKRPGQVIGMHFMNPVPVMKLVEVIRGYATTDAVTETIMELSARLGKTPVEVNDYPGFVANRILMPMINEAIYTLYEGVAGVYEIDNEARHGPSYGTPSTC
jgi:3-hydroxybutyryl-CoA dehydrogenase